MAFAQRLKDFLSGLDLFYSYPQVFLPFFFCNKGILSNLHFIVYFFSTSLDAGKFHLA